MCIDQFFSENAADQKNVLSAFLELLSGYDTILTFNGIGFDIPYLKAKCKALHLSDPFDAHSYIDLYKEVSRFKFLFALTSYKQKSIELFLGIDRIDAYSGGELIEVYKEYVRHPAKDSLALLKQHNYEDVLYMPKLLPVLSYPKLWEQAFSLQSLQRPSTGRWTVPPATRSCFLHWRCSTPFPNRSPSPTMTVISP